MPLSTFLITGATSGIGRMLVDLALARGAKVIAVGRNEESLRQLALLGCETYLLDLSESETILQLHQLILDKKPTITIHAAGYTFYAPLGDRSLVDLLSEHRLHTESTLSVAHAMITVAKEASRLAPIKTSKASSCKAAPYTLAVISSALAYAPSPGMSVYSAGKLWMLRLCQLLELETKPYLHFLSILPGPVESAFRQRASHNSFEDHSWGVVATEEAAKKIMRGIDNQLSELPLGPKAWLARVVGVFVPVRWIAAYLFKEIKKRYSSSD